jgi:hypothetical protein
LGINWKEAAEACLKQYLEFAWKDSGKSMKNLGRMAGPPCRVATGTFRKHDL